MKFKSLILSVLFLATPLPVYSTTNILQITVDEAITPVTEKFILRAVETAEDEGYDALLILLNTPGGLLESTRGITSSLMDADQSDLDTIVYVSPSGARAGSAGVFITLSAKYAAMAPACNIGAAHPVSIGGGEEEDGGAGFWDVILEAMKSTNELTNAVETAEEESVSDSDIMAEKIENDTVAYIESISDYRGRNKEWAVSAVLESDSITSLEAISNGVVDYLSENKNDLLGEIYGDDFEITVLQKTNGEGLLSALANPNLAYFFLILGFIGIVMEIRNPGGIFSGAIGALFFLLALFSNQVLPMNYAGLFLLILAFTMFILETFTPTFGLLTFGGTIVFILGSLMLFDSPIEALRISVLPILIAALIVASFAALLAYLTAKSVKAKAVSGKEGMEEERGEVIRDFKNGRGQIRVHGEIWRAKSTDDLKAGDGVRVLKTEGLTAFVDREDC